MTDAHGVQMLTCGAARFPFLVDSAPVSGRSGGGFDGLLSADFVAKVFLHW
jgi:hypothetical protein